MQPNLQKNPINHSIIQKIQKFKQQFFLDINNLIKQMKSSKAANQFITKFSNYLSKFKQSSTISIAHEQIQKLLSQYKFSQIAIIFISKMDSLEQNSSTQKQKKQYIKIYNTLIEVYGQDIILEYYDKLIQSIAKKGVGVSEVIGNLCRSLLKRIYPKQNIANYIKHLLGVFQRHVEFGKILKQIVQNFDSQIIAPFQSDIISVITDKILHNPKTQTRIQLLQATLATILCLQSKFYQEPTIQQLILKNYRNQDWNVRKICVDIAYGLFVINHQANKQIHQCVVQLKYDKIKHVRDSVGNYFSLYKQVYGEEKQREKQQKKQKQKVKQKQKQKVFGSFRNSGLTQHKTMTSKSPAIPSRFKQNQQQKTKPNKSLDKSIKNTTRNQQFFQNAGNRDVIKLPQSKSLIFSQRIIAIQKKQKIKQNVIHTQNYIIQKDQHQIEEIKEIQPARNQQNSINFEQYLKNRSKQDNYFNFSPTQLSKQRQKPTDKNKNSSPTQKYSKKSQKLQIQNPISTKAKSKIQLSSLKQKNIVDSKLIQQNTSFMIPSTQQINAIIRDQISTVHVRIDKFMNQVLKRLNDLQKRIQHVQSVKQKSQSISQVSLTSLQKDIKQMRFHVAPVGYLQQSFQQKYNDNFINNQQSVRLMKKQHQSVIVPRKQNSLLIKYNDSPSSYHPIESNLNQKITQSIKTNNWDQAFSLAITNNSKSSLLQLLKYCKIPKDKLVQDCLFIQLRRNLNNLIVLKWLNNYLEQYSNIPQDKLIKLQSDLQKAQYKNEGNENKDNQLRNYKMIKSMLLNQIRGRFSNGNSFKGNHLF